MAHVLLDTQGFERPPTKGFTIHIPTYASDLVTLVARKALGGEALHADNLIEEVNLLRLKDWNRRTGHAIEEMPRVFKGESALIRGVEDVFACDFPHGVLGTHTVDAADIARVFEGPIIDLIEITSQELPADEWDFWTDHRHVIQRLNEHKQTQDIRMLVVMRGFNHQAAVNAGMDDLLRSCEEIGIIGDEPGDFVLHMVHGSIPRSITICVTAAPGTYKTM